MDAFPDPGEFDKAAKWLAANWAIYDGEDLRPSVVIGLSPAGD
jgi:hypothetical protein